MEVVTTATIWQK